MESTEKLRVVLDTNVLLNALSKRLPYRHILHRLIEGKYQIFVSNEILLEYEEKITEFYSQKVAETFLETLAASSNVQKVEIFFRFNYLIDLDDNKFVDCAFAANAHFLVSDDRGFRVLKKLAFPKIEVLRLEKFSHLLVHMP